MGEGELQIGKYFPLSPVLSASHFLLENLSCFILKCKAVLLAEANHVSRSLTHIGVGGKLTLAPPTYLVGVCLPILITPVWAGLAYDLAAR